MLKSWSIQNFKAIVDSGDLKLAPVTILAGRNSSGKSSLLQSILMIAQTLSSRLLDRPLLPNDRIVQLGTFDDVLNEWSGLQSLTLGFALDVNETSENMIVEDVRVIVQFSGAGSIGTNTSIIEASKVSVENVALEVNSNMVVPSFEDDEAEQLEDFYVHLSAKKIPALALKSWLKNVSSNYLRLVPYSSEQSSYLGEIKFQPDEEPDSSYLIALSHFLPTYLIRRFKEIDRLKPQVQRILEVEGLENVSSASHSNLNIESLYQAVEYITRFFTSKIRYLGPLRADPQFSQKYAPSSELDDVGSRGEYAAAVYDVNQDTTIDWYNPSREQVEQGALKAALNSWARYLGVADQIKIENAGQSGFSWQVVHKEGHKPLPLSSVGVGVSQVLPILVMGLLSPKGSLLIIEQPELHLHPRVQARLGDFFMGLAKCNKQCLIETHSENLVSQLRYHIVQAGGQDKSDCIIYFVDQDEQGAAQFEPIKISPQGNILNWPTGFFDETMLQEDRITAASIRKRARAAKNATKHA